MRFTPVIKPYRIQYHRNGVGGASFYEVSFTYTEDNITNDVTAVVFDTAAHVALIDNNGTQGFRGDVFEPVLRELVNKYQENGSI